MQVHCLGWNVLRRLNKMIRLLTQILVVIVVISSVESESENESKLSSILLPSRDKSSRITRSYYERYGYGRPYDRLDDRRCGRCYDDDDRDDDRDDDNDDRRSNKPTYGSRQDRNRDDDDGNDNRYNNDNRSSKNETYDQSDDKNHDGKDGHRDKPRKKHRNKYDNRDRYYDRFLRDRNRDSYDRYEDPYPRRPLYNRNPYDDGYARYDGYSDRRPSYYDRYDRYDDGYGGYGPGIGAGPHDSFRPWDETYRGQSGWDAGGRGYYFASGRPDATAWNQRDYARPQSSGWQSAYQSNPGYTSDYGSGYNYREPYRGANGYSSYGTVYGSHQDLGYGESNGWRNVGETRRPYRDESMGFGYRSAGLDSYQGYGSQNSFTSGDRRFVSTGIQYGQTGSERRPYRDESGVTNLDTRNNQGSNSRYGSQQPSSYQPASSYSQSTTETSYLLGREDQIIKVEDSTQPDAQ